MNAQSIPEQETAEINYSFGQRLASARRALNLTQEQVAADLRLNVRLIKALEEENYSVLPTQMYIAGYLRNYARLLKIPVEPLLNALNMVQLESPPLISDVSRPRKRSYSSLIVKLFGLALLVVVLAGLVSWIQTLDFSLFTSKYSDTEQLEQSNPTGPTALSIPLPEIVTDDPAVTGNGTPESVSDTEIQLEAPLPAVKEEPPVEVVAPEKVKVPVVQPEIVKAGVELVLSFSSDSWVEVKDSTGEKLLYDLYRKGQSKQITGSPPFNVFLGNAAGVTVEYNGQVYDATAHVSGNIARFDIGRPGDYKSDSE